MSERKITISGDDAVRIMTALHELAAMNRRSGAPGLSEDHIAIAHRVQKAINESVRS